MTITARLVDLDSLLKHFYRLVFILPASAIAIIVAIANRHAVTFIVDPFSLDAPALSIDLPLFVIVFGAVFVGMLIGGAVAWGAGSSVRRKARTYRRQIRGLTKEGDAAAPEITTPALPVKRAV